MKQGKSLMKLAALLVCVIHLAACTASIPLKNTDGVTLPPPRQPYEAPAGDAGDSFAQTVLLCLPSAQNGQLQMFPERILLSHNRHPADYTLRKLFTYSATTQALPLDKEVQLSLLPGSSVEVSGNTAAVNLAASALALSNQDRYTVFRAITNTLTQWGDIRFVNVLISGRQLGIDTATSIPPGSLTQTGAEDAQTLWETANRQAANNTGGFSAMATLYFPAQAGHGILAEARAISSPGQSLEDLTITLLSALSAGAVSLPGVPQLPDLVTLLYGPPEIEEQPGSAGRVVSLHFHESANQALISSGVPRSVFMAALTYTLTTFLPYTAGIKVMIGNEQVSAVVPAGVFEGAGEEIIFKDSIMQRNQFSHFLLDYCSLYFANSSGSLSQTLRAIPYYQKYNPRYLLNQLMAGPMAGDSVTGLKSVLPLGLRDADLLGVTLQDETALVNFSSNLIALCTDMDATEEQLIVYSMVNTLTAQRSVKRVRFYVDSLQNSSFGIKIDLMGEFLRNEGIILQ